MILNRLTLSLANTAKHLVQYLISTDILSCTYSLFRCVWCNKLCFTLYFSVPQKRKKYILIFLIIYIFFQHVENCTYKRTKSFIDFFNFSEYLVCKTILINHIKNPVLFEIFQSLNLRFCDVYKDSEIAISFLFQYLKKIFLAKVGYISCTVAQRITHFNFKHFQKTKVTITTWLNNYSKFKVLQKKQLSTLFNCYCDSRYYNFYCFFLRSNTF